MKIASLFLFLVTVLYRNKYKIWFVIVLENWMRFAFFHVLVCMFKKVEMLWPEVK